MKNALRILVLAVLTMSLSSCEKISNLFDVEIETTIEADLSFVTDEAALKSTDDHGFNDSQTVDVLNADLSEYGDLIQDFNTQNITIEVISVDSSDVILRADSEFGISNLNAGYTWTLTADWPIYEGLKLTVDEASFGAINDILGDLEPITFTAVGTCNKGNVHITLNYGIDVLVKSNPL
jgi:hypothetical protein